VLEVHGSGPVVGEVEKIKISYLNSSVGIITSSPSVYAHVVQVPCSPMSPVIVALNALPPADEVSICSFAACKL
jgi:hypothetical protein